MTDAEWEAKMNEYGFITISLPKDAKVRTARKEETRRPFCSGRKRTRRIADLNETKPDKSQTML